MALNTRRLGRVRTALTELARSVLSKTPLPDESIIIGGETLTGVSGSECIYQIGYNPETEVLRLWFIKRGKRNPYSYSGVSEEVYENLMDATSQGEFVNLIIRSYPEA